MIDWTQIRQEYESSKVTLKALADKFDIKIGTLKSRKSREGWTRDPTKKDATKKKKVATPEPVIESSDLTEKQKLFCINYLKSFNATKAYQTSYSCSYTTAMVEGHRHLRNPKIKKELDRLKAERQQELFLSKNDILQKYIDIAFADITDFVQFGSKEESVLNQITGKPMTNEKGELITYTYNYVDFKDSIEVDGTIITEVKKGKEGVSVKIADKMKALEMLTKYFDLLPETQKRRLEEEKLKLELSSLRGETDGDAHDQSSSYEAALNAQAEDVFADDDDEVLEDEEA